MSKERVERAHALLSQTLSTALNVVKIDNVGAVRETLYDVKRLLEESLGMSTPAPPKDALRPVDAPVPEEPSMFDAEDDESGSSESELSLGT